MRVTGVGHAGLFVETAADSVPCDPWVNPDVGECPLVVDFIAREVREFAGEHCRYRLSTSADLVATNLARREVTGRTACFCPCGFGPAGSVSTTSSSTSSSHACRPSALES